MARPTKSVNVISKNLTKEEKELRLNAENKLRGKADNITPPDNLTENQKNIFLSIVNELRESNILSNLDIHILVTVSRAIDRLNYIESVIDNDMGMLENSQLMSSKDKYTKDLYRCCNELCLSPQARAKMGTLAADTKAKEEDPLLKILSGANG